VLLGLGPLGEEIGRLLGELRRPFVAVTETNPPADTAPDIPLVVGSLEDAMSKAHLHRARSIVALGEDEVKNLEAALIARTKSPRCTVVIRTDDTHFSRNVAKLVSGARPLGVYALAAEAFAAAAFGENVHDLLHIDDRAALVTDYKVEGGDTLVGKLIGEVAYGYGVVPLLLQRDETKPVEFFPSDDVRLQQGQRLVVLASIEGLRSIELGTPRAPSCRVHVDAAGGEDGAFDGAMALARISGCDVALAQEVMRALPATLTTELYEHQAERLVRELGKVRVTATYAARSR
jgi:Trk K+ transport system NAD-binding subunit